MLLRILNMDKAAKRLKHLTILTFIVSPLLAWGSVIARDETAMFAEKKL